MTSVIARSFIVIAASTFLIRQTRIRTEGITARQVLHVCRRQLIRHPAGHARLGVIANEILAVLEEPVAESRRAPGSVLGPGLLFFRLAQDHQLVILRQRCPRDFVKRADFCPSGPRGYQQQHDGQQIATRRYRRHRLTLLRMLGLAGSMQYLTALESCSVSLMAPGL